MHLFDIIIPTYNNLIGLERCLNSIKNQTFTEYQAWICDDGSRDGTTEYLDRFCKDNPNFTLLQHPDRQNHGRAINRNQALAYLSAKYVLMIDGDVECIPNLLEEHYAMLNKNAGCISIGYTNWINKHENIWANYISKRGATKYEHGEIVPYQYFTSQNVSMPTKYFSELEGFDPFFKLYGGEDTELAYRISENYQSKFYFNKKAMVSTESDKTLEHVLNLLEEFGRHNLSYISLKHPNCSEIFYLNLLKGNTIKANLYKLTLNKVTNGICYFLAKHSHHLLSEKAINLCVAYRIKKGYFLNKVI